MTPQNTSLRLVDATPVNSTQRIDSAQNDLVFSTPNDLYEAFAEFLQIDVANGDATEDTIRAYYKEIGLFTRWCRERNIEPEQATRRHIEAYRENLKTNGAAPATRQHKMSIVRRFYEAAVKHGLLSINPAANVKGGKDLTPPEEKIKALTRGALHHLVAAIPSTTLLGQRDRAIVALMAVHGLRRIEVHRLDHDSIDIAGDVPTLKVHGKGNRVRKIYLREDTYNAIQTYVQAKMDHEFPLTGPLFVSHSNRTRGQRISRRSLNDIIDHCLSEANLKKVGVSCHALRHTHGTLAVAGGAKVEHLKEEMGHNHLETTSIYVKAVSRKENNPANFIDVQF
ncbi:MAG TPA: tyrosine-type recombinase/integrase [Abditibacteriaceae bacterium]|jgi:site-specific recombinase XerD